MEDLPTGEVNISFCTLDSDGMLESGSTDGTIIVDKELETSAPLSFVTSSSSIQEDVENMDLSFSSKFPGYLDFDMSWRRPGQFDDPYVYFLNVPPRKVVRVGPDHQAEVPKWDPSATGKNFSGSKNSFDSEWERKMVGTCISPLPSLNDSGIGGLSVGCGRTDCTCVDVGSVRCVQQHVNEARVKLGDTIGCETFTKLGFYEMGEEVACKWTAEDEKLFHKVVATNPISHDKNFWKQLDPMFRTRTKKDLVSYYFNVFVLRRRGVQNRSYSLQIDSDNDEEPKVTRTYCCLDKEVEDVDDQQHTHGDTHLIGGKDEDSEVESFSDQDLDAGWVEGLGSVPENVCDDEDSNGNHGTCGISFPRKDA